MKIFCSLLVFISAFATSVKIVRSLEIIPPVLINPVASLDNKPAHKAELPKKSNDAKLIYLSAITAIFNEPEFEGTYRILDEPDEVSKEDLRKFRRFFQTSADILPDSLYEVRWREGGLYQLFEGDESNLLYFWRPDTESYVPFQPPSDKGLFSFSEIMVDNSKTRAAVRYGLACGGHRGYSGYILLRRSSSQWSVTRIIKR